jgi:hypothetical protein
MSQPLSYLLLLLLLLLLNIIGKALASTGVDWLSSASEKDGGLLFFRSVERNTKTLSPTLTSRSYLTLLPHTSHSHTLSSYFTYNSLLTISLFTLYYQCRTRILIIASLRYPCLHYTINVGRVYSTVRRGTVLLFFRSVNASVMSVIATMSHSSYFVGYCDRLFVFMVEYSKFSLSFFYSLEMSSSLIASLPVFCISCKVYKPADDFPRNRNGVPYKTCKVCKVY